MASQQPYQLTARTLALSDVIPTQAADGATEVGKNTIQDVADLVTAGEVVTVKVSLTSAEILNLFTTPKQIIAAPGAGFCIQPICFFYEYNYGTTTYNTNQTLELRYAGVAANVNSNTILSRIFSVKARQGSLSTTLLTYIDSTQEIENKAFEVTVQTGNPTDGDGTLNIHVTYCIISL